MLKQDNGSNSGNLRQQIYMTIGSVYKILGMEVPTGRKWTQRTNDDKVNTVCRKHF